ncbi:MAG TPA: DUF2920 family protein [Stellaceae bacterium]|nr:DUF2920 family protein [Stellaceae bacterium]
MIEAAALATPHPDIELGVDRKPLAYIACAPDAGIDGDTGLALFMSGYGMDPLGAYPRKLLAYLANRHNCVAASVRYFGAGFQEHARHVPMPDFFTKLAEHYGLTISAPDGCDMELLLRQLAGVLRQHGVSTLHSDCRVAVIADEYNNMGFLPALDCLQVAHRLIGAHGLNRRRLFAIGSSYGGFIAALMAKLAPNTFRLVVDNSGFSSAEDDFPSVMGIQRCWIDELSVIIVNPRGWSQSPAASNYFSPARREIRALAEPRHIQPNTARLYAYHAEGDSVAPTERKLALREAYAGRVAYDLRIVDQASLDGRLFKTLAHGMEASLRGLFDLSYERFLADGGALGDATDFDLGSEISFPCSGENYRLRYSRNEGVRAELR